MYIWAVWNIKVPSPPVGNPQGLVDVCSPLPLLWGRLIQRLRPRMRGSLVSTVHFCFRYDSSLMGLRSRFFKGFQAILLGTSAIGHLRLEDQSTVARRPSARSAMCSVKPRTTELFRLDTYVQATTITRVRTWGRPIQRLRPTMCACTWPYLGQCGSRIMSGLAHEGTTTP